MGHKPMLVQIEIDWVLLLLILSLVRAHLR